jgi:translation initiation factor 1
MFLVDSSDEDSRLVYSTEWAVPRLPRFLRNDKKAKNNAGGKVLHTNLPPSQQKATVRLDRKGRGGKSVTVIEGLKMPQNEREALLKQLKSKLGTGGTVKDTCLEIQGDHCDALMAALEKLGYPTKRSGG